MLWTPEKEALFAIVSVILCYILISRECSPSTRLNYSKFTQDTPGITVPSRLGMLIIYTPSLLVSCYLILSTYDTRLWIISFTSFLHYAKRVYEVLYVHHYSGTSKLLDNITISIGYMSYVILVYVFSSTKIYPPIFVSGLILFFVGESINYYHHRILSQLRQDGSKTYKIPMGGLFQYLWCPHYLGEIITFIAIACLSQHYIIFILQCGSAGYLSVRAHHTRTWYKSKFKHVPERWCLFPGVF